MKPVWSLKLETYPLGQWNQKDVIKAFRKIDNFSTLSSDENQKTWKVL
jgi:hypothetical protein